MLLSREEKIPTISTHHNASDVIEATSIVYENGQYTVYHLLIPVFQTPERIEAEQIKLGLMQGTLRNNIPTLYACAG